MVNLSRETWADGPPDPPPRVPEDVSQTLADYALDIERDFENLPHPQIQNVIRTLRELSKDFRGIRIPDTYDES